MVSTGRCNYPSLRGHRGGPHNMFAKNWASDSRASIVSDGGFIPCDCYYVVSATAAISNTILLQGYTALVSITKYIDWPIHIYYVIGCIIEFLSFFFICIMTSLSTRPLLQIRQSIFIIPFNKSGLT